MNRMFNVIRRKNVLYLQVSLVYAALIMLFRWGLTPAWDMLFFLTGSIIGVYFLDAAEELFALEGSPFRSIIFTFGLMSISLFIVTSSGSMLASGLVLLLNMTMLMRLLGEYRLTGSLSSWYALLVRTPAIQAQRSALVIYVLLFVLSSYLFIRS